MSEIFLFLKLLLCITSVLLYNNHSVEFLLCIDFNTFSIYVGAFLPCAFPLSSLDCVDVFIFIYSYGE